MRPLTRASRLVKSLLLSTALPAVLLGTPAAAQVTMPTVGVNYTNGNRFSQATMQVDMAAMRAAGVTLIRSPLELYNGSYQGTLNMLAAAKAAGIAVHMNISTSNPRFYPQVTQKRGADPARPSIYAAYRLSDLDPSLVELELSQILPQIDAMGVKLAAIEFGNEMGNPSFNGDVGAAWIDQGITGGNLYGFNDLLDGTTTELQAIGRGLRNYVDAVSRVRQVMDALTLNQTTPLVSGGLNTPGDVAEGAHVLSIEENEVSLNGVLTYMRANGLNDALQGVVPGQYGVHAYLWGNQTQLQAQADNLVFTQCGVGGGLPCNVTEWGYASSTCTAYNDTPVKNMMVEYRNTFAGYGGRITSMQVFDWKSSTYGVLRCTGTVNPSGVVALQKIWP